MSRHSHPRTKLSPSRRELLALAATGFAWNWGQPAACWALGDEPQAREQPEHPGRILAMVAGFARSAQDPEGISGFITIDPENGAWKRICDNANSGALSPDGKTLAINVNQPRGAFEPGIWTCDLEAADPPKRIANISGHPAWSPGGQQIVVSGPRGGIRGQSYETWRMDADGSNQVKLPLDDNDWVLDWSRDGQWLALMIGDRPSEKTIIQRIHPDGTGRKLLTENEGIHILPRFSPDSRRLLYIKRTVVDNFGSSTVWLVNVDGENRRQVPLDLEPRMGVKACWSPNGERLALLLLWTDRGGGVSVGDNQLVICDSDGKNRREVPIPRGSFILQDWR